ncbi:MAG: hypothetical protein RM347_033320 [Nostoc sp. ChiQUE02]|uniref:hypothetical protein n=1 Tax=Nostoc sp. ChiQUE02 TaxID=3075377 RepID=UPI002AD41AFF|nr:hypothetical protein [Nostoc sp. ChiQUE02]MDZ8232591.1 hypothetical protein [Nostoc sp. ChiQUE02]
MSTMVTERLVSEVEPCRTTCLRHATRTWKQATPVCHRSFFCPSNAVITTHIHRGIYKTPRNCDDYARIVKGSLQNLLIIPNSVKTA